jgi:hypothetical protein
MESHRNLVFARLDARALRSFLNRAANRIDARDAPIDLV